MEKRGQIYLFEPRAEGIGGQVGGRENE